MLLLNQTLNQTSLRTAHWTTDISAAALNAEARKGKTRDFAESIAGAVIFRINFPKVKAGKMGRTASLNAKVRPLLSHHDMEEARQTCALALVASGAMERGAMLFADWKIVFREVRRALNIDRNSKRGQSDTSNPIDLMTESEADFLTATTKKPYDLARRKSIARKLRYLRSQVFAAFSADSKRTRVSTFKKQLGVSRFLASLYCETAKGFSEILQNAESESALRVTIKRFRDYCETGETALTAESLANVKPRTIKSFADL